MNWDLLLNFAAAMFAILNPIGIIPVWKELTGDASRKVRTDIALMVTGTALIVLLIFLNAGKYLLDFFSIDLPVFKVAGGILLLLTGIYMVEGKATKLSERNETGDTSFQLAKQRFRKVLVPLAVPMLSGPGSLTTVILYSFRSDAFLDYLGLSIVLFATILTLLLSFSFSHWVEEKLDDLVFTVFTRIFGIMVTAIALQFILEGLGEVFPNWLGDSSELSMLIAPFL